MACLDWDVLKYYPKNAVHPLYVGQVNGNLIPKVQQWPDFSLMSTTAEETKPKDFLHIPN